MAFRDIQTAIIIDTLIRELVHQVIDRQQQRSGPCQKLFDILGIQPYSEEEAYANANDELNDSEPQLKKSPDECCSHWHSWLAQALAADSSDDEFVVYGRKQLENTSVQTEQPRMRRRIPRGVVTPGDHELLNPAPCEMTRQTIFIDAVNVPTPSIAQRPPLADRFCYLLTDFASALYCSLAIMCCCTPSMFR